MATRRHDFARFFNHYKKIFIFLGCLLAVQILLAIWVVVLHSESPQSDDIHIGSLKSQDSFQNWLPHDTDAKFLSGSLAGTGGGGAGNRDRDNKQGQGLKSGKNALDADIKKSATKGSSATLSPVGSATSVLDPGALTFTPDCEINLKESVSAITRAKTEACKEELAKTACHIINDSLYPKRLPRYCLNNETSYGKHLGCYRDEQKNRIFPDAFTVLKKDNSPSNCIDLCLQSGFQYSGVQYSIECFCGNSPPSGLLLLDPAECNMKCPSQPVVVVVPQNNNVNNNGSLEWQFGSGAPLVSDLQIRNGLKSHICGGFFAMNIYETGVFQDMELRNQIITLEDVDKNMKISKPARIVFLLTLNGRAYRQVIRLIKSLFHERHFFYIHVDARQDYLYRELLMLARKLPNNFRFMVNRRATIWGGASLLSVLLSAMTDLVTHATQWNWQWDYVINLSESDFPLKSTEQLETFLGLNNGRNFIKSHGRDVHKFIQKQGLDKTFHECEYRMWRMGDRTLPKGIIMDGGSDWIALHRTFVEYVVQTDDALVEGLKIVFKHTLLPAESFFHTTLRNSKFCHTFVDNNLHVTNWKRKLGCKCQYRNVVDWCGCSPNDFRVTDWARLQLTENRLLFFGRKFEAVVSQGIVNKLESWLYPSRFTAHFPTSDRFWQSVYHHYDLSPKADDAVITLCHALARLATKAFVSKFPQQNNNNNNNSSNHRLLSLLRKSVQQQQQQQQNQADEGMLDYIYNYESSPSSLKVIELSVYLEEDRVQGVLLRFHQEIGTGTGTGSATDKRSQSQVIGLEAWFKLKSGFTKPEQQSQPDHLSWDDGILGKFKDIQVGIDYDQKEQIFRHFSRAIGPSSEPTIAYNCVTDKAFNVTFVWLNPAQAMEAKMNVSIGDGSTANFVKPLLNKPLLPGNWTVRILNADSQEFMTSVEFLVMPLQFYGGLPISSTQARIMHTQPPIEEHFSGPDTAELNSKQCSRELLEWIDTLVSPHYEFQEVCLEKEIHPATPDKERKEKPDTDTDSDSATDTEPGIRLCSQTEWSSLYPDPKSTVEGIDRLTGRLVP